MYVKNVGLGAAGPFAVDFYGSCAQEVFRRRSACVDGLAPGAEKVHSA